MPFNVFTLENPLIKGFMENTSDYVPSSELVYIHTHLLEVDFVSEIESMIAMADQLLAEDERRSRKYKTRFLTIAEQLGQILPEVNETTAPRILYLLRDMYKLCQTLFNEVANAANTKK